MAYFTATVIHQYVIFTVLILVTVPSSIGEFSCSTSDVFRLDLLSAVELMVLEKISE